MRVIHNFIILITIFVSLASVYGAEQFGVQVYAGARLDAEETNFIRKAGGANSYCYRTNDSVKKVIAFYTNQPGIISGGSDEYGGMFVKEEKGHAVYIKVQSPWQPSKGGEMKNDTVIVISKE